MGTILFVHEGVDYEMSNDDEGGSNAWSIRDEVTKRVAANIQGAVSERRTVTTDKAGLIAAIEAKRSDTSYSIWTIGITDDAERRRKEHERDGHDVRYWKIGKPMASRSLGTSRAISSRRG